jgi:hypothetical protein
MLDALEKTGRVAVSGSFSDRLLIDIFRFDFLGRCDFIGF